MAHKHILFLFPGQGSQYVGIGSDIYQEYDCAKQVYENASQVLEYDIAELSFRDPQETINLTRYTQPVLLTHQMACLAVFKELTDGGIHPDFTAGHSLGEYSALVAAGALSFENALRLVKKRGELMAEHGEGEMASVSLDVESVQPLADKYDCGIAACNLPDQTVVGGRAEDLSRLAEEAERSFTRVRFIRLKTEGAFHTHYMGTAAKHFHKVLDAAVMHKPVVPVLSNYTGDFHYCDISAVKKNLFLQLNHPVLWYKNIQTVAHEGVSIAIEFGGGLGKGPSPADKRPNLQAMFKRSFHSNEYMPDYLAAINCETIAETVEVVTGREQVAA